MNYNNAAYHSGLIYERIVHNFSITMVENQTYNFNHGLGKLPHIRVWGELYSGEYSFLFALSTQFGFNGDYMDKGIYGYAISVSNNTLTIESYNSGVKRLYIRIYDR